jgi:endonuclease YncB( thermonuclease family)
VLNGDTIVVGGIHARLKGLAAPEVEPSGDPGGEAAKAHMVRLLEGQAVVCNFTLERMRGRRVGWCHRDGRDIAAEVIKAGLARDCPRYSGGRYAAIDPAAARELPFPGYCQPR